MDDHLAAGNSGELVCPHCQKHYQGRCSCRDSEGVDTTDSVSSGPEANEDAGLSTRNSASPEVRSIPDLQTRAAPPPPDDRTVPPVGVDHQLTDHLSLPAAEVEVPDELEVDSQPPQPGKDPQVIADSLVAIPVTVGSSSVPKSVKRPTKVAKSNRRPKWGWILVVGPLLVALAIIAWFQFRVLPPVTETNPLPAVDFPAGGIASRPSSPSPPPVLEEPPQESPPPASDPANPASSEIENDPNDLDDPAEGPDEQPDPDPADGDQDEEPDPEDPVLVEPVLVEVNPSDFQQFGTQAFINLFDDISHLPNLAEPSQTLITGDDQADQKLRAIADSAGYIPQPMVADSSQLIGAHQLQPLLAEQWSQLEQAATAAGYSLVITTGYLSASDQTNIFLLQIDDDLGDQILTEAVGQVMVPGYSRHQTGFAVDIVDGSNPGVAFVGTEAYNWLSADNFAVAKHFGFIPSRAGVSHHGQAEHQTAFELVYVGRDHLISGG